MPGPGVVVGEWDDAVGEKHFGGNICHVGSYFVVEPAGPSGRATVGAAEIKEVGVAYPLPQLRLRRVSGTSRVRGALDQPSRDAVVVERAVEPLEDAALSACGNQVIGVTAPDEPFHAIGVDAIGVVDWVTPKNAVAKIGEVSVHGDTALAKVGHALGVVRFLFGARKGRQKHGGQNGDDGDDNEQFDESEGGATRNA